MTGQGDPRHEQIVEQRQLRSTDLYLGKDYRTADGKLVRSLAYNYRKQKTFLFGELKETGLQERCITGQIKINHTWEMHTWKTNGEHDYLPELNLVEYKSPAVNHAELFSGITPGSL